MATSTGAGGAGGSGGSAGAGGQGGSIGIKEVEVFKCDTIFVTPAAVIFGQTDNTYEPSEVTLNVGDVLRFEPSTAVQNMESGFDPEGDGKFHTLQGATRCLQFNVAGTYPFFSLGSLEPMSGTVFVK